MAFLKSLRRKLTGRRASKGSDMSQRTPDDQTPRSMSISRKSLPPNAKVHSPVFDSESMSAPEQNHGQPTKTLPQIPNAGRNGQEELSRWTQDALTALNTGSDTEIQDSIRAHAQRASNPEDRRVLEHLAQPGSTVHTDHHTTQAPGTFPHISSG